MDGALISIRDPLQMTIDNPRTSQEVIGSTQRLGLHENRDLKRGRAHKRGCRRAKPCMKQVVSGLFSGLNCDSRESDIINLLVQETRSIKVEQTWIPAEPQILKAAQKLTQELKNKFGRLVECNLTVIVDRLLDQTLKLGFHHKTNNCQFFCENILDKTRFQNFLDSSE